VEWDRNMVSIDSAFTSHVRRLRRRDARELVLTANDCIHSVLGEDFSTRQGSSSEKLCVLDDLQTRMICWRDVCRRKRARPLECKATRRRLPCEV
jgi:hypothetical protein